MASYNSYASYSDNTPPCKGTSPLQDVLSGLGIKAPRGASDERFNFDKWIRDNQLEEISDCLIDYNMNTVNSLDLYSTNALNMMRDERIIEQPAIIPVLMSAIISLKTLKIMVEKQSTERYSENSITDRSGFHSGQTTPISMLSTAGGRTSRKSSRSARSPFDIPGPTLHDLPSWDEWEPPLNETKQEKRTPKVAFKDSPKIKSIQPQPLQLTAISGINIPLSGINIKDCKRSNFSMNSIDSHPQSIIHSLQRAASQSNTSGMKTWILNICFYIVVTLFIYFNRTQSKVAYIFLVLMIIIWIIYTFNWIVTSLSIPEVSDGLYDKDAVCKEIERLIEEKPMIKWNVKCYHPQTIKNDMDGLEIETREVRVETLEKEGEYVYTSWKDISVAFPDNVLKENPYTELKIYKAFTFKDKVVEDDYYHRAELFRKENDNGDDYQYLAQWMELKGWIGHKQRASNVLVKRDLKESVALVSKVYLAVFSCLMCGACYRTYVSRKVKTNKMEYVMLKEISL